MSDLIIYTDFDGLPWAAFVWGEASPATVSAMITAEAVEAHTGFDVDGCGDQISWPPRVQTYWMCAAGDDDEGGGFLWNFCASDAPGATMITGHRFYPQ